MHGTTSNNHLVKKFGLFGRRIESDEQVSQEDADFLKKHAVVRRGVTDFKDKAIFILS